MNYPACRGCSRLNPDGSCRLNLDQTVTVCPSYEQKQIVKPAAIALSKKRVAVAA